MALNALAIYKQLPQKNCGECGVPTCLGFAMKLVAAEAELSACPYLSPEAVAFLGASTTLPLRKVELGDSSAPVVLGGEEVLFRHEKRFHNPSAIFIRLTGSMTPSQVKDKVKTLEASKINRAGEELTVQGFGVELRKPKDLEIISALADVEKPPLVVFGAVDLLRKAVGLIPRSHRLLLGIKSVADIPAVAELNQALLLPYKWGETLRKLADNIKMAEDEGVKDVVIALGEDFPLGRTLGMLTHLRRLAIEMKEPLLNRPILYIPPQEKDAEQSLHNALFICRYASGVVMDSPAGATLAPMMVLRSEIYADPQKPIQIPAGIYTIGTPTVDSPVLFTTNFSLTYFLVSGDIEASGVPAHLLVVDVEGQSVLTAYSAGKLTVEKVTKLVHSSGIEDKVNHRRLVIPGLVSRMSGELAEACGWEVLVGPKDSSRLPTFLRSYTTRPATETERQIAG